MIAKSINANLEKANGYAKSGLKILVVVNMILGGYRKLLK
jgi:hypothetical protein